MIAFGAPWVLSGLALAAVPILLHLLARREPPTVDFPAVRYLSEAAERHQRRLALRHWVLLLVRTLLIVLLVLAAAGPSAPRASGGAHLPTALALVVDNSLSAGAAPGGVPVIDRLRAAALEVAGRAGPADALWLLTADGHARQPSREALRAAVESLGVSPRRMDLVAVVALAGDILAAQELPGEVVMVTDLQRTALGGHPADRPTARPSDRPPHRLTVLRPGGTPPRNAGIARLDAGTQPWIGGAGRLAVHLTSGDTAGVPVAVTAAGRAARPTLAAESRPAEVPLAGLSPGWVPVTVELASDELRLDDRWQTAVRVAPPARAAWDPADRFVAAAAEVLLAAGRIQAGPDVALGRLGPGRSVVLPPADPAVVGALNRDLAARGIGWQFGERASGPAAVDSGGLLGRHPLARRHRLEPRGSGRGVLATAGGEPWLVRSGPVVLVGSRFDTAWTRLPLTADFVPFLDALVNRLVQGDLFALDAAPGDPVVLPDLAEAIEPGGRVEGGGVWRAGSRGVHYILAGADTIGAISVNPDPRESVLDRAGDDAVRAAWPAARVMELEDAGAAAFADGGRADLRLPLLLLALVVGGVEAVLAGWRRKAA